MQKARTVMAVALVVLMVAVLIPAAGCQSLTGKSNVAPLPRNQTGPVTSSPGQGTGGTPAPDTFGGKSGSGEAAPAPQRSSEQASTVQQMIVRDKTLTMEVPDVRKAQAKINALALRYGGSIASANISSQDGGQPVPLDGQSSSTPPAVDSSKPLSGTITIKVPVAKFDIFTAQVRKLGTVQAESESTEDVTQQHVDMKARLKNLRAEEAAFLRFFKAATNVREMITIENQLARVRGEIESLQAQLDYLEQRAALATLTVKLSEPGSVVSPSGQNWGFVDSITQAIRNFVGVINFLIMMVGALLPLVIISLLGFWLVRWLLRRFVFARPKPEDE